MTDEAKPKSLYAGYGGGEEMPYLVPGSDQRNCV